MANGDWDNQVHANEKAKYGCYDSGQGCGGGTHSLSLSGNMLKGTSEFGGYKVIQSKIPVATDTLINADMDGTNAGNGVTSGGGSYNSIIGQGAALSGGLQGFNLGQSNDEYYQEFETITLPESFTYFGQEFTHIYVNESGFLTFGNGGLDSDKPWNDLEFNGGGNYSEKIMPHFGGGRVLQYLDDSESYLATGDGRPDVYRYPDAYGKPGTSFEGNLNNSIFALWSDYLNDSEDTSCADGCNDFSIRKIWDANNKILTIGWYK